MIQYDSMPRQIDPQRLRMTQNDSDADGTSNEHEAQTSQPGAMPTSCWQSMQSMSDPKIPKAAVDESFQAFLKHAEIKK